MKMLLRAACGHEAVFDPQGYEKWPKHEQRSYVQMIARDAYCAVCGDMQEASAHELERLARLNGDESHGF